MLFKTLIATTLLMLAGSAYAITLYDCGDGVMETSSENCQQIVATKP